MAFPPDRPLTIEVTVKASQPVLLEGLDIWLRLGLLSHTQVKQLCRTHLVCSLPAMTLPESSAAVPALQTSEVSSTAISQTPNFISRILQSLMAEISVLWLLFLGVFMVVVSSGVLAASQWRNFPPVGQYGILFGYTLAFWVVSAWASRQQNLRLTARMLQIATLLIIPVNF